MVNVLRFACTALALLLGAPALAQRSESPLSMTLGVAYQGASLDLTAGATGDVTVTMTSGLRPTLVLYAQIPFTAWWRSADEAMELGYTLRAGYRPFELTQQDLGDGDVQDYGTRVSGHALYAMPHLVLRHRGGAAQLTLGLGLGVGQFSVHGEVLAPRFLSGPPYYTIDRIPVSANTWTRTIGAFGEYRIGALVAAMESAILLAEGGGDQYEVATYSFSLAWRVDF